MKKHTTLAERLEHVLEEMDWSQADLSREVECTPQAVNNWLNGRNKNMEPEYAYRLEDKYQWNARWLLEGGGDERVRPLSPEEQRLVEKYREMEEKDRADFKVILERF